jgi:hypothetical protein
VLDLVPINQTKMGYEYKELTGSIFKNKNKKDDKHPEYTGVVKINGDLMDVALWVKNPGGKDPFFSMKISEKRVVNEIQNENDGLPF